METSFEGIYFRDGSVLLREAINWKTNILLKNTQQNTSDNKRVTYTWCKRETMHDKPGAGSAVVSWFVYENNAKDGMRHGEEDNDNDDNQPAPHGNWEWNARLLMS